MNVEFGIESARAVSFLGIHKSNFLCSVEQNRGKQIFLFLSQACSRRQRPLSCLGSLFGRMELLSPPGLEDRRQVRVRRRQRFVVRPAQVEEGILETDCVESVSI